MRRLHLPSLRPSPRQGCQIRAIVPANCCARNFGGDTAAVPPSSIMKSRHFIGPTSRPGDPECGRLSPTTERIAQLEMPRAVALSGFALACARPGAEPQPESSLPQQTGVRVYAATRSLSALRITILSSSSGNGRCSAFAPSQGARSQASRSLSVVRDHRHRPGDGSARQRHWRGRQKP